MTHRSTKYEETDKLSADITTKCGRRVSNEDYEVALENLDSNYRVKNSAYSSINLYVICDGHGGSAVSKFVGEELAKNLYHNKKNFPMSQSNVNAIYDHIQKRILNHPSKIGDNCGSTALVVIVYVDRPRELKAQIINLGDCRCVASNNYRPVSLTTDHKPSWPGERKRIEQVNKTLHPRDRMYIEYDEGDYRINGLSVCRAFGDTESAPFVTHIPDVSIISLKDVEFLVMACDGVWDVLRSEDTVIFVHDHLDANNLESYHIPGLYPAPVGLKNKNSIAEKMANYAIARGSQDNISIILIYP